MPDSEQNSQMTSARLEAFSDGVIAVIITIMVLELHVPHEDGWAGFWSVMPRLSVPAELFDGGDLLDQSLMS